MLPGRRGAGLPGRQVAELAGSLARVVESPGRQVANSSLGSLARATRRPGDSPNIQPYLAISLHDSTVQYFTTYIN